jgi:hypothetical protein
MHSKLLLLCVTIGSNDPNAPHCALGDAGVFTAAFQIAEESGSLVEAPGI